MARQISHRAEKRADRCETWQKGGPTKAPLVPKSPKKSRIIGKGKAVKGLKKARTKRTSETAAIQKHGGWLLKNDVYGHKRGKNQE